MIDILFDANSIPIVLSKPVRSLRMLIPRRTLKPKRR